MNPTTPYEQLIAAKLDQVPVPDMADSIWASIEVQLDAPPADAPSDAPAKKPVLKYKNIGWYGAAGLAAVVAIVLWWYYSHKGHAPEKITPPPTIERAPTAPPRVEPSPPPGADTHTSTKPIKKNVIKTDTASFHNIPIDSIRVSVDSAIKLNLPPVKVDSSSLQKNRVLLPDVDLYSTPPPAPRPKKHRGVKGITDDDYKISAGKDSGRKKD